MTRKHRLLSISTLYPNAHTPRFGTFVARSLEALAKRGDWDVTLINPVGIPPIAFGKYKPLASITTDGTDAAGLMEHGVTIHRPRFPLIPKLGARINPGVIARKILPLARRLHAESPFDLVDAQFFYPDGPAAAQIAKDLRLPFSIKARGADISFWGQAPSARKQILHAADQAAGMLAVSNALADEMAAMGMDGAKITLHYTGLDRDRFRPLGHSGLRTMLGKRLGITLADGKPLLATVGALIPRKGQSLVINALAGVPEAQLLLVGYGPDEQLLRNLARDIGVADRVHFLGSVDHDVLPLILSASDIMVLPSASEGLANAWVEAIACGTPIVLCDVGGARELVTPPGANVGAGLIVERNSGAVCAGIKQLLANPPSPEIVAASAERFNWSVHAENLAAYYDRLIEQR